MQAQLKLPSTYSVHRKMENTKVQNLYENFSLGTHWQFQFL